MKRKYAAFLAMSWGVFFWAGASAAAPLDAVLQKAEKGDLPAQVEVCRAYSSGVGIGKDLKKAAEWCRKAAEAGSPEAQVELGDMYENGRGVPADLKQASQWYQKAAEQGYAEGQRPLGVMYELGKGVPKDPAKAAELYRKAADQGLPRAQVNLGILYETGVGVPQDYGQAVHWYQESIKKDYYRGMNQLGMMYEKGLGVEKSPEKAFELFSAAAAGGYDKGKDSLARLMKANPSLKKTGKPETTPLATAAPTPPAATPPAPPAPAAAKPDTAAATPAIKEEPAGKGKPSRETATPGAREKGGLPSAPVPAADFSSETADRKPAEAEKHFHLGNEYAKQGRYDLAVTEYKTALELDAKNSNTYENLAIAYAKKGSLPEAIDVMRSAIKLDPRDASKRATLGILHHANKDEARAMDEYVQAVRLNPAMGAVYNNMAAIFAQSQLYEKAWKCAKLAQALGHNEKEVVDKLRQAAPNITVEWSEGPPGVIYLRQLVVEDPEKAEKMLAQLQKGEDFAALVRTQGVPKYNVNGGYLGPMKKEELEPAIAGEVAGLKPFAFSPVLKTQDGFRIFQRVMIFEDLLEPVDLPDLSAKGKASS